jgi:ferric-dicitrate binding protein FerR (iron transport regulator)
MDKVNKAMPDKLSELLKDDSFIRFLKGNASEEETEQWTAWMQQSAKNEQLAKKTQALLNKGIQTIPKPDSDLELERLMERIDSEHRYKPLQQIKKKHKRMVWATMAAAAGILLLVGFLARHTLLQQNDGTESSRAASINYQLIETTSGQKTTVRYSDGSEIVMNANSQMRVPERTRALDTMRVWLEGEALFSITRKPKDSSRTFIVHTPDGNVSVLGTEFSVNTTEGQSKVVLKEGKVRVEVQDSLSKNNLQYDMEPNQMALFSRNLDQIKVEQVNPEVYTSWASDSLVLDQTPLSDLVKRIEFTYDVEIIVNDKALMNKKITGRFKNLDLSFILEGIAKTLDVNIEKREQTVYINKKTDS